MARVITMGEIMLRLSTPGYEKFIQADEFDVNYGGDYFYFNNGAEERCPIRGGGWYDGTSAGLFYLSLSNPRSYVYWFFGGRCAFAELPAES